jgi:glutathione reductase (NADPH)
MSKFDFDLVVIGGGSGGVRAARVAAQHGARVAIVESANYGGTCVHRGCVPKKLLVQASRFPRSAASARGYGWTAEAGELDWRRLISHKDTEIDRLEDVYERNLQGVGVQTFHAHARLVDAHTVQIDAEDRRLTAERVLVATGGRPATLDIPGKEFAITSDEAFHLEELPKRVVVVGGGYIAVEFAGIFRGLGSEVDQIVRGPRLLSDFDEDIAAVLERHMTQQGIRLHLSQEIARIDKTASGLVVTTSKGSRLEVDTVMQAVGRRANTDDLGLQSVGVTMDNSGAIVVDEQGQTNIASIHAIGDVTDRLNLTPVAIREGQAYADRVFGGMDVPVLDHQTVPTAVFTSPEIGVVGLTEQAARARYPDLRVLTTTFRAMTLAFGGSPDQVYVKVLVDRPTDRVVGVHLLGEGVAEMIQFIAVAMIAGATWEHFRATVALHPTIAEEIVTLKA